MKFQKNWKSSRPTVQQQQAPIQQQQAPIQQHQQNQQLRQQQQGQDESATTLSWDSRVGRDDFRFFWNFITASQILPCVIETRRYGYIRDSGSRVETPHRATIGCEKFYNGCFHCCGHFWDKYTSALVHNFVCYQNSEIWLYTGLWK